MTAKLGAKNFVDFSTSKDLVGDAKALIENGLGPHAAILVALNEKPFQQAAECKFPSDFMESTDFGDRGFMDPSLTTVREF
jgi:hypothetical protein